MRCLERTARLMCALVSCDCWRLFRYVLRSVFFTFVWFTLMGSPGTCALSLHARFGVALEGTLVILAEDAPAVDIATARLLASGFWTPIADTDGVVETVSRQGEGGGNGVSVSSLDCVWLGQSAIGLSRLSSCSSDVDSSCWIA